ncbi:MAG: hypothetical protein AAF939_01320 [Planctomycetota bacterium]
MSESETQEQQVARLEQERDQLKKTLELFHENSSLTQQLFDSRRNIAPWDAKFYIGLALVIVTGFLVICAIMLVCITDDLNWSQAGAIGFLALAFVGVIALFFKQVKTLNGR